MRAVPIAALVLLLAGAGCAEQWSGERPLTFPEIETLDLTTPILRVTTGPVDPAAPGWIYGLNVWARYGMGPWQVVYRAAEGGLDITAPGPAVLHILLHGTPSAVRAGCVGYYTGPAFIDDACLILPDGEVVAPTGSAAVNRASNVEQAIGADGKCATVSHTAGPTPGTPTVVDAVEFSFDDVPEAFRDTKLSLAMVALKPAQYGLYHIAGADSDPHETLPGWVYRPDPEAHAFYDFLVPQSNNPALFSEIRAHKPDIRIIARLTWPGTNPLDYFYKPEERERIEASIREQLARGTKGLYGVYLGDEEPAHFLHGWYGGGAPEWATRYADTYRDEKGADFDWDKRECRDWIIGKGRALWDDLYRIIKSVDPDLKVMPFLYVPGDLSGWGMWDPKEIKADGWVYQWYYHDAH